MDCEGSEVEALRGAAGLLSSNSVRCALIETHLLSDGTKTLEAVIAIIRRHGFEFEIEKDRGWSILGVIEALGSALSVLDLEGISIGYVFGDLGDAVFDQGSLSRCSPLIPTGRHEQKCHRRLIATTQFQELQTRASSFLSASLGALAINSSGGFVGYAPV